MSENVIYQQRKPRAMASSSNKPSRQQRRPHQRAAQPPTMREGANDRRIVRLVYAYRVLSQKQLEILMGLAKPTVQRLLRRLYDHHYLERVFLPVSTLGSSPALYILDSRGLELLRRLGIEDFTGVPNKSLSSLYLEHTLAINAFRIAVALAAQAQGWELAQWVTENAIKADYDRVRLASSRRPVALVPDGYFSLRVPERGVTHFFLEVDRGTMAVKRFKEKVAAYVAYYRDGGYQQRYGAQGFRVLTVVQGVGGGRVSSLRQASAEVFGIGRRFWFVNLETVQPASVFFQPIWQIAGAEGYASLMGE